MLISSSNNYAILNFQSPETLLKKLSRIFLTSFSPGLSSNLLRFLVYTLRGKSAIYWESEISVAKLVLLTLKTAKRDLPRYAAARQQRTDVDKICFSSLISVKSYVDFSDIDRSIRIYGWERFAKVIEKYFPSVRFTRNSRAAAQHFSRAREK